MALRPKHSAEWAYSASCRFKSSMDVQNNFSTPHHDDLMWLSLFGKRGKLSPRFVGPFKILERIGSVAYRLELPLELNNIHDVFHVSNLKKCLIDESLIVPLEEIQIEEKLQFSKEPVNVMDREVKVLKRSLIPIIKVRWNS
ncbi:hypothetical protein E3N88_04415 [Mikania micrantha]|uniref:Tf2-1-like SH3-like domain-containing protein n=1 Tax=Mikania micrantha TaxID=192012 RepID=A0A5N6PVP4_9ASTR|nr:hypothetical protein E3N88_04415 [Mikania micrantha]